MSNYQILLADNTPEFLETYGAFLEGNGYNVLQAHTPAEAQNLLENDRVHFAILDLRLVNDNDELDKSGLQIAKNVARSVPKMILTNFPVYQDVVEVMRRDVHHLQPAVEFMDKKETTLDELAAVVSKSLQQYAQINWDLAIRWQQNDSFLMLVSLLEPDLPQVHLGTRTAEFEDLFRKLFCDYAQITIGQRLAVSNGRIILPIFAYNAQGVETRFMVSCGRQTAVSAENERYEKLVPRRFGIKSAGRLKTSETTHYGATAYTFMGADLEKTTTFTHFYANHHSDEVTAVLEHLYRNNLAGWYRTGREEKPADKVMPFYAQWSGLAQIPVRQLHDIIAALAEKALAMSVARVEIMPTQIQFKLGDQLITTHNPVHIWENKGLSVPHAVLWGVTHGRLNGDTVLVDGEQHGWVIDFAQVARTPLLIDFVSLETAVKYDIFDCKNVAKRIHLEQCINQTETLDSPIDDQGMLPAKKQVARSVAYLRHLAADIADCTLYDYQYARFYAALAHVAAYEPDTFYTPRVLSGYVHALFEAAVLAEKLLPQHAPTLPEEATDGLWLDQRNKVVWVEGRYIPLTPQEYKILDYLHDHAGELCEKKEIVEQALDEIYDEYDPEQSRLTTAVSRLRRKLEPSPRNPRYLITIHGRGYRLDLNNN